MQLEDQESVLRSAQSVPLYINGKKPTFLPGADDAAICISGGLTPDESTPYPAPEGYQTLISGMIHQYIEGDLVEK